MYVPSLGDVVFDSALIHLSQYLPMSTLLAGVKAGQLHQGHFNANQYNYLEVRSLLLISIHLCLPQYQGSVPVPAFDKPVLLIGREHINRATQGDIVAVEVFPESEWKAPADEVVDQESEDFAG